MITQSLCPPAPSKPLKIWYPPGAGSLYSRVRKCLPREIRKHPPRAVSQIGDEELLSAVSKRAKAEMERLEDRPRTQRWHNPGYHDGYDEIRGE